MLYKCPICRREIELANYYKYGVIVESNLICENRDYSYCYFYGNFYEIIGKNEWFWDYDETVEERTTRKEQKELVLYEILSGNVDFVLNKKADFYWKKCGF